MMFKSSAIANFAILFVSSAFAAPSVISPRLTAEECENLPLGAYNGGYSEGAVGLAYLCAADVSESDWSTNIYRHASCVAAAGANGLQSLTNFLSCNHGDIDWYAPSFPHLDFGVYASIVGDCAYDQPEACPITQQNFVDLIYSQIDDTCEPAYPNIDQVQGWWTALTQWTATGNTSPYHNFDDWLHYSS